MSVSAASHQGGQGGGQGRLGPWVHIAVFAIAVVVIAVCVNVLAERESLRWRGDATKTRAYSLSPQSQRLLSELEGEWTIGVVLVRQRVETSILRQVEQVLGRYAAASDALNVQIIDPTEPASFIAYERLLERLRTIYADRIDEYDVALDEGERAWDELVLFVRQQSAGLEEFARRLTAVDPEAGETFAQRAGVLVLVAEQGEQIREEIVRARQSGDDQPLADYETARSILAAALVNWSNELFTLASSLEEIAAQLRQDRELSGFAAAAFPDYQDVAQRLASAAEPLRRLEPLELGRIGRHVQEGDAAVVIGPQRAAVIDSSQLFPATVTSAGGGGDRADGRVTFDQRFRGEQIISATIRSLQHERMPTVVFVHAEERSILQPESQRRADVAALADMLEANRFRVREWRIGRDQQPAIRSGERVVWVPIAPTSPTIDPTREQRRLVSEVERLIDRGEPVLLSVYPSLAATYRQPDGWRNLVHRFGLDIDTSRAIFEHVTVGRDQRQPQGLQLVQNFDAPHPIAAAVHGRTTQFPLPMPVTVSEGEGAAQRAGEVVQIARIQPRPNRYLVDWARQMMTAEPIEEAEVLAEAKTVMVAGERSSPEGGPLQRYIVVGSGGWLLSNVTDAAESIGGGRAALRYPGNVELFLACVTWLAGYDDLIAPSPTSQEIARLDGLTGPGRAWWGVVILLIVPVVVLVAGTIVWLTRRV